MDGFSYHDIFATKGIEYLLIIFYLLLFVVIVALRRGKTQESSAATGRDDREQSG